MAKPTDKVLKFNPTWCKGCGICIAFCPTKSLELHEGKARLKAVNSCILCGNCEQRCPDFAVYLEPIKGDKK